MSNRKLHKKTQLLDDFEETFDSSDVDDDYLLEENLLPSRKCKKSAWKASIKNNHSKKASRKRPTRLSKAPIHFDILKETLRFLNRNEVKKCQLVCYTWNRSVLNNGKLLPFHLMLSIQLGHYENPIKIGQIIVNINDMFIEVVNNTGEGIALIESLKYCVFQFCSLHPQATNSMIFKDLNQIAEISGSQIHAIEFTKPISISTPKLMDMMKDYIIFDKLKIEITDKEAQNFFLHPPILPISVRKIAIAFEESQFRFQINDDNFVKFLKSGILFGSERYSFNVQTSAFLLNFIKELIYFLKQSTNPQKYLHAIKFYRDGEYDSHSLVEFKSWLELKNFNELKAYSYRGTIKRHVYYYKRNQPNGYTIKVFITMPDYYYYRTGNYVKIKVI